ncbi:MAG: DUF4212 domain-containing protein [Hyphomicrobiaceae bacterium]
MIEKKRRKPYWRETKQLMAGTLLLPFVLLLALPFWGDDLDQIRLFGFPLGYAIVAHGAVILVLLASGQFITRQDDIDHWHGAHDEL